MDSTNLDWLCRVAGLSRPHARDGLRLATVRLCRSHSQRLSGRSVRLDGASKQIQRGLQRQG